MPITVKHLKVSTVPDAGDDTLVEPSDWNADHTLTGLGTMAEQNANAVAITGGTISGVTIPASNVTGTLGVPNGGTGATTLTGYVKGTGTTAMTAAATIPNTDITGLGTASTKDAGAALGVATLDAGGKVPVSELPAAVLGALSYQGTWDAATNTPTLTSSVGTKGYYYVVSVAGNTNLNGITDWLVGDWAVYNGSIWQKVDNTETVTSVNGQTGAVTITLTGLGGGTIATQNANAVAITGGSINGTTIGATTASTGAFTTATASTSVTTPIVQATNSGGLALRNSAGTTQISMGGGGGDNVSINVATNINGANAQIDISPTGTGHVHIKPTGTGSLEIAPTNAGTINNMVIGGTTPLAITGTTITATSFVGSGASLTNVVNSLAASTGISVSGSTGAVTVTNTAPDQTVVLTAGTGISTSGTYPSFTVTNTAPDQTVAISSGTGISVSGTYPNFTVTNTSPSSGGTVTSVTGTAPVVSSGGNTPAISMAAATGSVNGYLTSTDWTTFNNKGSGSVTSVSGTGTVSGISLSGTVTSSGNLTLGGTLDLSSPPAIGGTAPNTVAGTVIQATNGIVVNSNTVSASYTIPSGSSAMSAGPMTIASGQTVTVSSGSRWVVL
jgi:hypothetical protein